MGKFLSNVLSPQFFAEIGETPKSFQIVDSGRKLFGAVKISLISPLNQIPFHIIFSPLFLHPFSSPNFHPNQIHR